MYAEYLEIGEAGCRMTDQPWTPRQSDQIVHLPLSFLWMVVDQNRIGSIRQDDISDLRYSIQRYGILNPIVVIVRQNRVFLKDGHHRLLVADSMKMETLPAKFMLSRR